MDKVVTYMQKSKRTSLLLN